MSAQADRVAIRRHAAWMIVVLGVVMTALLSFAAWINSGAIEQQCVAAPTGADDRGSVALGHATVLRAGFDSPSEKSCSSTGGAPIDEDARARAVGFGIAAGGCLIAAIGGVVVGATNSRRREDAVAAG